jgi:hypothetical protein
MSVQACRNWEDMVAALADVAGIKRPSGRGPAVLVQTADAAIRRLRIQGSGFTECITKAVLAGRDDQPPPQTRSLAQVDWPLVISTNYDDLYLEARRRCEAREQLDQGPSHRAVMGRSRADCQRVLASLRWPDRSIL